MAPAGRSNLKASLGIPTMTDLPSKDTIEAIEKRIGKWPITTVLWVLFLTVVISRGGFKGCVATLVSGGW